jgi:hypothetical protein
MKRPLLLAVLIAGFTLPLLAQSSEFGLLFGGSKRMNDAGAQGQSGINDFKFGNSVKEIYYGTEIDPGTIFRIKAGSVSLPLVYGASATPSNPTVVKGKIDHVDAVVDYRFSEPFGSTGLFAGVGMYRQSASGQQSDTNVGLSGGVNADFPLSRRYGIVGEATYHWVHTVERQRFVTLTGGLRISF